MRAGASGMNPTFAAALASALYASSTGGKN
jgi:hypothetical protein